MSDAFDQPDHCVPDHPLVDPPSSLLLPDRRPALETSIGITLIICTRDRCKALAETLIHVECAIERVVKDRVQVIIVDDGSSDATGSVMAAWFERTKLHGYAVTRPKSGLAASRNAALREATNDVIVMIDDDCHIAPEYLERAIALVSTDRTDTIRGGCIMLGNSMDLPITIKVSDERAVLRAGVRPGGFIMGANLVFQKSLFDSIGGFDERFGAGGRYLSAEDTDFFFRAAMVGVPVLYEPCLVVKHFHGRRHRHEREKLYRAYAVGNGAFYAKHMFKSVEPARQLYFQTRNVIQNISLSRSRLCDLNENLQELIGNVTGMTKYLCDWIVRRI